MFPGERLKMTDNAYQKSEEAVLRAEQAKKRREEIRRRKEEENKNKKYKIAPEKDVYTSATSRRERDVGL